MRRDGARWVVVLLVAASVATAAALLPLRQLALGLADGLAGAGAAGIAAYFGLFILGAIAIAPVSAITALAGLAYGLPLGFAIAMPAASLAATVNFLLARSLGRARVERAIENRPRWRAVWRAAEQRGVRWVLLLRLSPVIPFAALNYLMGTSRMRLMPFVVASTIGKAPTAFLYVYAGSAARRWAEGNTDTSPAERALFWAGLVATAIVVVQVTRVVQRQTHPLLDGRSNGADSTAKARSDREEPSPKRPDATDPIPEE